MKRNVLIIISFFFILSSAFAQTGTIRGTIIDDETAESLIGATVVLEGTTTGTTSDLDGNFTLTNVPASTINLHVSYVGYQSQSIKNVEVNATQVNVLKIRLKPESFGLEEVVVQAEIIKNNEAALLTLQRKASGLLDGISSSQFAKTGDSDAASAIKRVTGVSVEGGKYVYVRGLGDRYSKTTLNGAEIPSLDPNRNTVQMDMFPSNLLDNLIVYKTFSPEIPASFTGGYVNISTKEFPEQFTFQVSGSTSYNTNTTFKEGVLTHELGKTHWMGVADKNREMPDLVKDGVTPISYSDINAARQLEAESQSFKTNFPTTTYSPFLNHNFSASIGDQRLLFGRPLGVIGGISYQRSYEFYDGGDIGRYFLPGNVSENFLDTLYNLKDTRAKESVLLGGMVNTTYKITDRHKVGVNLMHNQSGESSTRYLEGLFPFATGDDPNYVFQGRASEYTERSLSTAQLKGDHVFGSKNIKFNWSGAYTTSSQKEPNLMYFNNIRLGQGPEYTYDVIANNIRPASRYFRDMKETNMDVKTNLEVPFKLMGNDSKFKTGVSFVEKERDFSEKIFQYRNNGSVTYNGNVEEYFSNENIGLTSESPIRYGLFIRDETAGVGSYKGLERTPAAYAMVDAQLTKSTRISTGIRYEKTDITIENLGDSDVATTTNRLERNDVLPALNLTQQLGETSNFRVAYGRTVARPTFRELARFKSFDFQGDFILIGTPTLERTTIDNIDLRYEIFPRSGEIFSVSTFYKKFANPIERAVDPNTNDLAVQIFFRNVPQATLYGAEFEFRKGLDFISDRLANFFIGTNLAYIYSRVDISEGELGLIRVNDPEADAQRVMFGQSPYIANALLSYDNKDNGLNANVSFNVQGPSLVVVSTGGTPNVFEQARPTLDFNIRKAVRQNLSFKISAGNLLNPEYRQFHEFKGVEYDYSNYRLGRNFSVGVSYSIE